LETAYVLVKIEVNSRKEIQDIITNKIRHLKNVVSTTTLSVIPEQGGT